MGRSTSRSSLIELTLYTRRGCHLCENMAADLAAGPWAGQVGVTEVEVGWSGPLAERHGNRLPVLALGEREICHAFLDEAALARALAEQGQATPGLTPLASR